jgi:predicted GIY-YIG superfamily endonuclease
VYVEEVLNMEEAVKKDKKLKKSRNEYKIELIKSVNPTYKDLCD